MNRIPAAEITGFKGALVKRFAKKALGQVPSSLGVFSGSRWEGEIYPVLRTFIEGSRIDETVAAPA